MHLSHPETIPYPLVRGKTVFHETGPWCQKGWVALSYGLTLDTVCLEMESEPTGLASAPQGCRHTHNFRCQSQVQLTASYQLATSWRFPQPYPWVQLT